METFWGAVIDILPHQCNCLLIAEEIRTPKEAILILEFNCIRLKFRVCKSAPILKDCEGHEHDWQQLNLDHGCPDYTTDPCGSAQDETGKHTC